MEIDTGLRVLVMARAYDRGCCFKALHSGALDYLEAPLRAADIIALLDTFLPRAAKEQSFPPGDLGGNAGGGLRGSR
jgi:FixJ family two-component response regulator